jgi:hypothetical protein
MDVKEIGWGVCEQDSSGAAQGKLAGYCKQCNEYRIPKNAGTFLISSGVIFFATRTQFYGLS